MAVDTELREGIKDWRRHLMAAIITATPLVFGIAVAWGVLTAKVNASGMAVEQQRMRLDSMETRLRVMETQNAVVIQRLDDLREGQSDMTDKIDKFLDR